MIVTRTPFRTSFLGGGTDLPWFYSQHGGGATLSMAIDKYMYLSGHKLFASNDILLKYSRVERVSDARMLDHPIARELLNLHGVNGLDISSTADIPSGTGLGSSSAYTVGLSHLVREHLGLSSKPIELAEEACAIEIGLLKEPIGKQDQYASAFGGFNLMTYDASGKVQVTRINLCQQAQEWLDKSLLLIKVGPEFRNAGTLLTQQRAMGESDPKVLRAMNDLRELTLDSVSDIRDDITRLGPLMKSAWELKKLSNASIVNQETEDIIEHGYRNGAIGAKLLGAGGGGFVLFISPPEAQERLIECFGSKASVSIRMAEEGSTVIYSKD